MTNIETMISKERITKIVDTFINQGPLVLMLLVSSYIFFNQYNSKNDEVIALLKEEKDNKQKELKEERAQSKNDREEFRIDRQEFLKFMADCMKSK